MFCSKCGGELPDGAQFCSTCGQRIGQAFDQAQSPLSNGGYENYGAYNGCDVYGGSPNVPDYLVWAILETVLCCLPCGIVGIVYAAKANNAKLSGDFQSALAAANTAKIWLIVGLVGYLLSAVAYLGLFALGIALEGAAL